MTCDNVFLSMPGSCAVVVPSDTLTPVCTGDGISHFRIDDTHEAARKAVGQAGVLKAPIISFEMDDRLGTHPPSREELERSQHSFVIGGELNTGAHWVAFFISHLVCASARALWQHRLGRARTRSCLSATAWTTILFDHARALSSCIPKAGEPSAQEVLKCLHAAPSRWSNPRMCEKCAIHFSRMLRSMLIDFLREPGPWPARSALQATWANTRLDPSRPLWPMGWPLPADYELSVDHVAQWKNRPVPCTASFRMGPSPVRDCICCDPPD